MGRARIEHLTDTERELMGPHADEWIEKGRCTDVADWEAFERGARECYRLAGIPWPGVVVRVSNPLVLALAAPMAARILRGGAVHDVGLRGEEYRPEMET